MQGRSFRGPQNFKTREALRRSSSTNFDFNKEVDKLIKDALQTDDHKIPLDELCTRYETSLSEGLTTEIVLKHTYQFGLNNQASFSKTSRTPSKCRKFLRNFFNGFSLLLWIGSIFCYILYSTERSPRGKPVKEILYLAIVLTAVAIVVGGCSYFQSFLNPSTTKAFKHMVKRFSTVLRNGQIVRIPSRELTVGDICFVKSGEQVPADMRIIESHYFMVVKSHSPLSGLYEPTRRSSKFTNNNPIDSENMAFWSMYAVEGMCKGMVINVGSYTFMRRIADIYPHPSSKDTLRTTEHIRSFVRCSSLQALFVGAMFFITATASKCDWKVAILFFTAIIIANVPQGIPFITTVSLSLTAKRMGMKNCLVKNFKAIETLASTTIICTDMNGSLIENKMSVSHIWIDDQIINVNPTEEEKGGNGQLEKFDKESHGFTALTRCAVLCCGQDIDDLQHGPSSGPQNDDGSDAALLSYMELVNGKTDAIRAASPKVCHIPYNSFKKYQVSIHKAGKASHNRWLLIMKGAPEGLMEKCSTVIMGGREKVFTPQIRQTVKQAFSQFCALGEHVVAFCDLWLPEKAYPSNYQFDSDNPNFPLLGLRFVGLISLWRPIRSNVPAALARCRSAKIKIAMFTKDPPTTAKATAKYIGIISEDSETVEEVAERLQIPVRLVDRTCAKAAVISGPDMRDMGQKELIRILRHIPEIVFARTTPQQNFRIVTCYKSLGEVVAVIGFGIGDVSASSVADISASMNIRGSDASKEVANIILMDDNFSSLVDGVEEGRLIFRNLTKSTAYILTSNVAGTLPFFMLAIFQIPLPLGPAFICIDLVIDMVPALSIMFEQTDSDIMKRWPRNPSENKLKHLSIASVARGQIGAFEAMAGLFAYYVVMASNGWLPLRLFWIHKAWINEFNNELEDSYGQNWTFCARMMLQRSCQTAFMTAIIITQLANLIIRKARKSARFTERNWLLIFAIVYKIVVALLLSYCPGINELLQTHPMQYEWWFCAVPFVFFIITFDAVSRFTIRKYPIGGWLKKEFY